MNNKLIIVSILTSLLFIVYYLFTKNKSSKKKLKTLKSQTIDGKRKEYETPKFNIGTNLFDTRRFKDNPFFEIEIKNLYYEQKQEDMLHLAGELEEIIHDNIDKLPKNIGVNDLIKGIISTIQLFDFSGEDEDPQFEIKYKVGEGPSISIKWEYNEDIINPETMQLDYVKLKIKIFLKS